LTRRDSAPAARRHAAVALCILLAAGASRPLSAQDQALVVSLHGGRHFPVVNLTDAGDDLAGAFSFGGGLALQLNPNIAIRAQTTYHRTRYRGTTVAPADSGMAQYVVGGDLQIGWPSTSSWVPYVYFGGGVVATDFDDASQGTSTRLAGRFGVGINRVSRVGAWFFEVDGLLHKYVGFGLSRTQFDVETKLGFALALGL